MELKENLDLQKDLTRLKKNENEESSGQAEEHHGVLTHQEITKNLKIGLTHIVTEKEFQSLIDGQKENKHKNREIKLTMLPKSKTYTIDYRSRSHCKNFRIIKNKKTVFEFSYRKEHRIELWHNPRFADLKFERVNQRLLYIYILDTIGRIILVTFNLKLMKILKISSFQIPESEQLSNKFSELKLTSDPSQPVSSFIYAISDGMEGMRFASLTIDFFKVSRTGDLTFLCEKEEFNIESLGTTEREEDPEDPYDYSIGEGGTVWMSHMNDIYFVGFVGREKEWMILCSSDRADGWVLTLGFQTKTFEIVEFKDLRVKFGRNERSLRFRKIRSLLMIQEAVYSVIKINQDDYYALLVKYDFSKLNDYEN